MKPPFTPKLGRHSLAIAGTLFATGLMAVGIANPDDWLKTGFQSAINQGAGSVQTASVQRNPAVPIAGSEAYWLAPDHMIGKPKMMQPAAWSPPVNTGDRFTITAGGQHSEYEIVQIQPLELPTVQSDAETSTEAQRQFLIICRTTDRSKGETLKFLMDSKAAFPWTLHNARTAHAL